MTRSSYDFFGSVGVRIQALIMALGLLTAGAVVTGVMLFKDFSRSIGHFQEEIVPYLRESEEVIEMSSHLGDEFSSILVAGDMDTLRSKAAMVRAEVEKLERRVRNMDGEVAMKIARDIAQVDEDVSAIEQARIADLRYDQLTLQGAHQLQLDATELTKGLAVISDARLTSAVRDPGNASPSERNRDAQLILGLLALERAIQNFQSALLEGSAADDFEALGHAEAESNDLAETIRDLTIELGLAAPMAELSARLQDHAHAETGILAMRRLTLQARNDLHRASSTVGDAITEIIDGAVQITHASTEAISRTSGDFKAKSARGMSVLMAIGGGALILILAVPLLAVSMIIRPLNAVTAVTERLSTGDMSPVTGLEKQRGEIGRMAAALRVFRDNMLERQRLEKEESARQAEEVRREAENREQAAQETRRREEAERKRVAEAEAAEREREERQRKEREASRARLEAERQAHAEKQDRVVSALAAGMKNLASGNLDFQIETSFPEDYEELRRDFNDAVQTLSEMIAQIADGAERIDGSAGEIASASNELSKRTETQAASLEETAAALEQLTASVRTTAQNAKTADEDANKTRLNAEESGRIVRDAVEAMGEIENSSDQISRIVGVIDEIAFQTNLLALNAGVEAARAGDAGRGFAVVVSEVRSLAQRSSQAAKEIKELIASSAGHVDRGVELVRRTGKSLEIIVKAVANVASLVNGIASAAHEQSNGLAEINTSVNQLDQVTQQNAAMVEESTAASNDMKSEAQTLSGLFSKFKVGRTAPHRSADAPAPDAPPHRAAPVRRVAGGGGGSTVEDWSDF